MIGIGLAIIKCIGLLLLFLLALLLLVTVLVFCAPLRYEIGGEKTDRMRADVALQWLFGLIRVRGSWQEGQTEPQIELRFFGRKKTGESSQEHRKRRKRKESDMLSARERSSQSQAAKPETEEQEKKAEHLPESAEQEKTVRQQAMRIRADVQREKMADDATKESQSQAAKPETEEQEKKAEHLPESAEQEKTVRQQAMRIRADVQREKMAEDAAEEPQSQAAKPETEDKAKEAEHLSESDKTSRKQKIRRVKLEEVTELPPQEEEPAVNEREFFGADDNGADEGGFDWKMLLRLEGKRELVKAIFKCIRRLAKGILPKQCLLKGTFGTGDPVWTGYLLAMAGILRGKCGEHIQIKGDFSKAVAKDIVLRMKGRILPGYLVYTVLAFGLSKPVRRILKLLWKGRKQHG